MSEYPSSALMPTARQTDYAVSIAKKIGETIPANLSNDRVALSKWISERTAKLKTTGKTAHGSEATSKQVGYAERIARRKRIEVPRECFQDAALMSRWINYNR